MKDEKSVIIEAAVADLMQFAEQLIWKNPEIQKKMEEMELKPEAVKAGKRVQSDTHGLGDWQIGQIQDDHPENQDSGPGFEQLELQPPTSHVFMSPTTPGVSLINRPG